MVFTVFTVVLIVKEPTIISILSGIYVSNYLSHNITVTRGRNLKI